MTVQPVFYTPPPPKSTSGISVAAMVLGITGAVFGCFIPLILNILAIILGHAGLSDTKDGQKSGRGMAIAGLVLGYVFIGPWIAIFLMGGIGSVAQ